MARGHIEDFLHTGNFHVLDMSLSIPPILLPMFAFKSVTLPNISTEVFKIKEGNYEFPRKVIKSADISTVTLERGVSLFDSDFYDWMRKAVTGQTSPKNLLIVQFTRIDPNSNLQLLQPGLVNNVSNALISPLKSGFANLGLRRMPGRAWLLSNCIPLNYRPGSDLDAMSADVSIASLELEVEEYDEISLGLNF